MKEENLAIGIDLGGTNIKGVLIDTSGKILHSITADTYLKASNPGNIAPWKEAIAGMVLTLQEQWPGISAVGIAAPGLSDHSNESIAFMPGRLQELENLEWQVLLHQPGTKVLNDAHAALIAESRLGVGKGIKNQLMVTLGTGVGGAILVDGKLYQGFLQRAGHVGHMSLNTEGQPGILDIPGTLEEAFGNASVLKRSCGKFNSVNAMVKAYEAGDTLAAYFWLTSIQKLSLALCSLINIMSPELIILGGGIAQAKDALMDPLTAFMKLYEWKPGGFQTSIKLSQFNEFSGAIGAALYALTYKEYEHT
jgi:glucokinase